jgi:hypothetical protein
MDPSRCRRVEADRSRAGHRLRGPVTLRVMLLSADPMLARLLAGRRKASLAVTFPNPGVGEGAVAGCGVGASGTSGGAITLLMRCATYLFDVMVAFAQVKRGVAQLGSAPALGAGGRRFESGRPDHHLPPETQAQLGDRQPSAPFIAAELQQRPPGVRPCPHRHGPVDTKPHHS